MVGRASLARVIFGLRARPITTKIQTERLPARLPYAALTIGTATIAPISSIAVAGGGGPDKWCGAVVVPTEADTIRNASWAVSCNRHASRSLNRRAGWQHQRRAICIPPSAVVQAPFLTDFAD